MQIEFDHKYQVQLGKVTNLLSEVDHLNGVIVKLEHTVNDQNNIMK